jgi:hypothetical protein
LTPTYWCYQIPLSPNSKASSRADSITSADGYEVCLGFGNFDRDNDLRVISTEVVDNNSIKLSDLNSLKLKGPTKSEVKKRSRNSSDIGRRPNKKGSYTDSSSSDTCVFESMSESDPLLDFLPLDEMDGGVFDESIMCLFDKVDRHVGPHHLSIHFDHWNAVTPATFFDAVESTHPALSLGAIHDVDVESVAVGSVTEETLYSFESRPQDMVNVTFSFSENCFSSTQYDDEDNDLDMTFQSRKRGRPRKAMPTNGEICNMIHHTVEI